MQKNNNQSTLTTKVKWQKQVRQSQGGFLWTEWTYLGWNEEEISEIAPKMVKKCENNNQKTLTTKVKGQKQVGNGHSLVQNPEVSEKE